MVAGTACLLTYSFIMVVGGLDRYFGTSYQYSSYVAGFFVVPALLLLALPLLRRPGVRRAIDAVNIGLALLWSGAVLLLHVVGAPGWLPPVVVIVLGVVMHNVLLCQWNLHYALNRLEDVGLMVWLSAVLSVLMLFVYLNSSVLVPIWTICALPLASAGCCLYIEVTESSNPASPNSLQAFRPDDGAQPLEADGSKRASVMFYSLRSGIFALLGVASGTFSDFYGFTETNYLLAVVIAGLALVAMAALLVRCLSRPMPPSFTILLPFQLAFALITVYMGTESDVFARIAIGLAWLVAHVFSLNELPTYRELTGDEVVAFAYREKAAMLIPYSLAAIVTSLLISQDIYIRYPEEVDQAVVYYMLIMVVIYGIALTRHILLYHPRQPSTVLAEAGDAADGHATAVAERHALTPREREVLLYLSRGYSRPYIEKKLFISKGTAKTHIFRIFQKLGVTSQDELIELVEKG